MCRQGHGEAQKSRVPLPRSRRQPSSVSEVNMVWFWFDLVWPLPCFVGLDSSRASSFHSAYLPLVEHNNYGEKVLNTNVFSVPEKGSDYTPGEPR